MKKSREEPSASSLRELPEVELSRYRVRKNIYAGRIAREGAEIVHAGPSAASLADLPEADFAVARVRPNPYASRAAESVAKLQYGRGRPRAGHEVGPTMVRSLRLPQDAWRALEAEAREKHTTVHALLRELVTAHLEARVTPRRGRQGRESVRQKPATATKDLPTVEREQQLARKRRQRR
jgi:hypothetical protein